MITYEESEMGRIHGKQELARRVLAAKLLRGIHLAHCMMSSICNEELTP